MRLHEHRELAVGLEQVQANFARYGLLDDQVRFVPGLVPRHAAEAGRPRSAPIAVLRLDGDMYESTIDALTHLEPLVSPGRLRDRRRLRRHRGVPSGGRRPPRRPTASPPRSTRSTGRPCGGASRRGPRRGRRWLTRTSGPHSLHRRPTHRATTVPARRRGLPSRPRPRPGARDPATADRTPPPHTTRAPTTTPGPGPYDDDFFAAIDPESYASAGWWSPGCSASPGARSWTSGADRAWIRACRDLGVPEVVGVDGAYVPAEHRRQATDFIERDLDQPLAVDRRFSLDDLPRGGRAPAARAGAGVRRRPDVARPRGAVLGRRPGQGGTHHVNEQWSEYWVALFEAQGWVCRDAVRPWVRATRTSPGGTARTSTWRSRPGRAAYSSFPRLAAVRIPNPVDYVRRPRRRDGAAPAAGPGTRGRARGRAGAGDRAVGRLPRRHRRPPSCRTRTTRPRCCTGGSPPRPERERGRERRGGGRRPGPLVPAASRLGGPAAHGRAGSPPIGRLTSSFAIGNVDSGTRVSIYWTTEP